MNCYDKSYALLGFTVQSVVDANDTIGSVDNITESYCNKISKDNTFEPRLSVRLSSLLISSFSIMLKPHGTLGLLLGSNLSPIQHTFHLSIFLPVLATRRISNYEIYQDPTPEVFSRK
jgi:hypothetical protein